MLDEKPPFKLKTASREELLDVLKQLEKRIASGQDNGRNIVDHSKLSRLRISRDAVDRELSSRARKLDGRDTLKLGIDELIASAKDDEKEPEVPTEQIKEETSAT